MTDQEKDLAEKAKNWFADDKAKESVRKSFEKTLENIEKFKRCRRIDPETLRKAFTI